MNEVVVIGAGVSGLSTAALLTKENIPVRIFEKSSKVGGRTTSSIFRNHILDNGFHIMPFYKTSALYQVLKNVGIVSQLNLAKVHDIAFYNNSFYKYPKGITDILTMSIVPLKSRIKLLKILLPMAFSSMEKAEKLDSHSLTEVMSSLDKRTGSFFEAVCMLAFADTPEHVSLGEFVRTIIRANPFKGGTSEFAYPNDGGYDTISKILSTYIRGNGGIINLSNPIKKIVIKDKKVLGVVKQSGEFHPTNCVVISHPAYLAINEFFDDDIFDSNFKSKVNRLNKTTSVIEVHFCLSKQIDKRQVVFPVGDYTAKGIFFISNITPSVSPPGEHLLMTGTPVPSDYTENPSKIKETVNKMRSDLARIYPNFEDSLLWERPMAWKLVEAVVKEPGLVWKNKMPHEISQVEGLFFVGDSTISYGIGTDSAAHSSILCHPKIIQYLSQSKGNLERCLKN
jgi:protoporphyrinogen oxidase